MDRRPTKAEIHAKLFNYGIVVLLLILAYAFFASNEEPKSSTEMGPIEMMTAPPKTKSE